MLKKLVVAAALAGLTACASVPNPIDARTRETFYVKDAGVTWSVNDAKRVDKPEYVAGKEDMVARLEAAVEQEFKTSPAGAEPVVFNINVKTYSRVNAAVGNMLGGSNMVVADVTVAREDGSVVGVYKDVFGMYASNGGVIGAVVQAATKPDIVGIMANGFAADLRKRYVSK